MVLQHYEMGSDIFWNNADVDSRSHAPSASTWMLTIQLSVPFASRSIAPLQKESSNMAARMMLLTLLLALIAVVAPTMVSAGAVRRQALRANDL